MDKEKRHTNHEPVSYSWLPEFADLWLINARDPDRAWPPTDTSMRPPVVKLLFGLRHGLLLQSSIEQVASLNVRSVFASNELLSGVASFRQTPNAVFAQG